MRHLLFLFSFLLMSSALAVDNVDPLGVQSSLGLVPATQESMTPPAPKSEQSPAATAIPAPNLLQNDYIANTKSDVFGAQLFTGNFAQQGATQFNPDYLMSSGDQIQIRLWGGYSFESILTVDPQGNIFLPQVGPIKVRGVMNRDLQRNVESAVARVFRANVFSYASLAAAQPVRVFVGGYVNRPGLYNGTSMDSVLHYLDLAGGIDPDRGSYLDVTVRRGEEVRANINLYDFLLSGKIPLVQLLDGDVIFVSPRHNTFKASGEAENAKSFEFKEERLSLKDVINLAKPKSTATHARIVRNTGTIKNVEYFPMEKAGDIDLADGDEVEFTADKIPGTITVRVEGEHQSQQEFTLPYGSRVGDLLKLVQFNERSDAENLQLYRASVRDRQKIMLQASLKNLEASVLTARSGTGEEARLRKDEADMILQWVDRAKSIEPNGQVVISQTRNRDSLLLENGDIIKIPQHDGLILVSGEVLFPNTIAFDRQMSLNDYINRAGGYTQNADDSRIVVAHRDGSYDQASRGNRLREGDEVLVLPKVDVKERQLWKEMIQIVYQIAVSARIVTRF